MSLVRGRDINIYVEKVDASGAYVVGGCATNLSMEVTAEEINITTADSGKENEYDGGATDCSVGLDGVITIDELPFFQYEDWRAAIGTKKNVQIDFTDSYGDMLRYQMTILITGVSAQGDANDFGSFSISAKRSGAETVTKIYDHSLVDGAGELILDGGGNIIRV